MASHSCQCGESTCQKPKGEKPVDLGFVEEAESPDLLLSYKFPSKVGGQPAWLSLQNIPGADNLACHCCGKPCVLLLQIYCPDDCSANCFHRTLFIFVCRQPKCYETGNNDYFRVFRSQLPRKNEFYSDQPPVFPTPGGVAESEFPKRSAADFSSLCLICGARGTKICARCRIASYCGKDHQRLDWKVHKQECKEGLKELRPRSPSSVLFPELYLATETEEDGDEDTEEEVEEAGDGKMEVKGRTLESCGETFSCDELEKMSLSETDEDVVFQKFKKRIARDPLQVLRYQRGGNPLWVSRKGTPSTDDIPACTCGAKRQFEFQILPQLLNHLGADSLGASLDWGTLAVYTCERSCHINNTYAQEVLWKQDFVADGT